MNIVEVTIRMSASTTGDIRILQYFPNKSENVFFHFWAENYRCYVRAYQDSPQTVYQAIERAVKNGGVNFICHNNRCIDQLFMEQVIKCKKRYPFIKLVVCYKDKSDYPMETSSLADQTVCLFPDISVKRTPNYLECMLTISGQIITYIGEKQINRSRFIKECNEKKVPFINLCITVHDNPSTVNMIFNQGSDLITDIFHAAQNIVTLTQHDKRFLELQDDRETLYIRLEQEKDPNMRSKWIAKMKESDQRYQKYLTESFTAYGTQQMYALAKSIKMDSKN